MLTIWKYELEEVKEQTIKMPVGTKILSVKTQYGKDVAYALVDTKQKDVLHEVTFRTFELEKTGEQVIQLPVGTKILSTKTQHEKVTVHTAISANQKDVAEEIEFRIHGTERSTKEDITEYEIKITDEQVITMPVGTQIVSTKTKNENVILYTLVDAEQKDVVKDIKFRIHGTGHPIQEDIAEYEFLDTVELYGGSLMFHIFYKK